MTPARTLMAVMAHPDDESTSVGGVLAQYAASGVRTIVVTCTDGELGDGPEGAKPGRPGHEPAAVAAVRAAELGAAGAHLGVAEIERLGYGDSGPAPDAPPASSLCGTPVAAVAARLVEVLRRHRPDVVVTHDPEAGNQHRDHVRTGLVTTEALRASGVPARLYYKAHGARHRERLRHGLAQVGRGLPAPSPEVVAILADIDRRITDIVDARAVADRKHAALHSHASQLGSSLAARLTPELFREAFGIEEYIRVDAVVAAAPRDPGVPFIGRDQPQ